MFSWLRSRHVPSPRGGRGIPTAQRREALLQLLGEEQARHPEGWLPWREFMRLALYHPVWGYYAAGISTVGAGGDFTTAPALHDGLARAVLRWAETLRQTYPGLRHAPLLEIGPGSGHLAASILALRPGREFFQPYGLVEVSPPLRQRQKQRLRGRPVRWFSTVAEALQASQGKALIICNELVDAFPCSVWELRDGNWLEWCLRVNARGVEEGLVPRPLPASSIFSAASYPPGQRVETHETWQEWLAAWTPSVQQAAFLMVDYGDEASALYHRRPQGSLRAYWQQQRFTGPAVWARFGQQDLTADVNFTDLRQWAEALGWQTVQSRTLRAFLPEEDDHATARQLRDETGAGGAFRVLSLLRGCR